MSRPGLLLSFCENQFKKLEKLPDLRPRDDQRRQKTKCEVVRAVDKQAALHGFGDKRRAFDRKLDADHQAFAANFANEIEKSRDLRQAFAQLFAASADIVKEFFLFDDAEKFESNGARKRPAAKGRAMHPRGHVRRDRFGRKNGAKRKPGGQRLGDYGDVRVRREFLIGEQTTGAPQTALNLIGNQQSPMLRGKSACSIPKGFADGMDTALSLNGFDQDGANGVVEFGFKIGDIVEADKLNSRNHGREGQAIFFRCGDTDGAKRAAVKRILQRQEAMLLRGSASRLFRSAAKQPRQLHRPVNRFCAAVGEEYAPEPGPFSKPARQRALKAVVIEVRKMNGAPDLAANNLHNARMRVAERIDGDAPQKIEIFVSGGVENISAAAMRHDHGLAFVGGQEKLLRIGKACVPLRGGRRQFLGFPREGCQRTSFG